MFLDESEDFITSDGSDDHGTRLMQQSAGRTTDIKCEAYWCHADG
ncbi:hypothetical protein BACI348_40211 [Bacillus altitudinis]|uniref:Uncharacterized protein n=1 Tax=Bacillus altitudinis TaxID=293387 RepID=A0A653NVU5_BACAB|nr:hypothetical protein BACI348_40211 [Bacillus altitudinis]